jgi:hypothetical protein
MFYNVTLEGCGTCKRAGLLSGWQYSLGVGIDSGWDHRDWGVASRSWFDTTNLTIKGEAYRNDLHETLVAAGLSWAIGHSGAQRIGANAPI